MPNKEKIKELLVKEQNQILAKFFLQKIDLMQEGDLRDLYFLLTSVNKEEINALASRKSEQLQKQLSELKQIEFQSQKAIVQYQEKKNINADSNFTELILHNLL